MKRRFLLLLFVHVFVVLSAIAVTIDGVRYEIYNGSATVCGLSDDYNGNGNVVIPQYIEYKGKYEVKSIAERAFESSSITSVTIPNSVTYIGKWAFDHCYSLSRLILGNSLEGIGFCAFSYCRSLTSVTIPNSVKSIGGYAFLECSGLTTVVIGSGAKDIYGFAFQNCDNVKEIFCYVESTPSSCGFDFNIRETATLHVPAKSIDLYKKAKYWKDFKNIVALTDNDPKPTGVINIKDEIKAEERYYDLHGHHVNKPSKGIYIINGKKVLIK